MYQCEWSPRRIDYSTGFIGKMQTVVCHWECKHCKATAIVADPLIPDPRNCTRKPTVVKAKWNVPMRERRGRVINTVDKKDVDKKDYPAKRAKKRA
jgi:hypothetical protein